MDESFKASLDLYDDFLAHALPDRLQKILARYELFKMTLDVPGDIVECGVFKGSGIYTLAKFQKIFAPNNEKKILGFDFFQTEREIQFSQKIDQEVLDEHSPELSDQEAIIDNLNSAGIHNVELIAGDVIKTTKEYAMDNPGFRIAFLYLDVDNYEGTMAILENFYHLVSRGGVVAFDEYAMHGYGESDAVDEYFRDKNVTIKALPWANTPSAYMVKP